MLKNAGNGTKNTVTVPFSNMKYAIAQCLEREGYVGGVFKKTKDNHPVLELLVIRKDGAPRITDVSLISKPSRRMYMGVKEIKPVRHGKGLLVLSTPKGILTGESAKKEMVGGEALFKIW